METIKTIFKIGLGPSSSHTMGPDKAIRLFIEQYNFDFCQVTLFGSLALTGKGHLTDVAISNALEEHKIMHNITFDYERKRSHPNTFKIVGYLNEEEVANWTVRSIGGGNISIDGFDLNDTTTYPYEQECLNDIISFCKDKNIGLIEYVNMFESTDQYLNEVLDVMFESVERGLNATGMLHGELSYVKRANKLFSLARDDRELLFSAFAYAVSEENACGHKIVTAPTCGACGIIPSILYYYSHYLNYERTILIDALKIAGLIGTLIRHNASISGAEAGCQAEVGSATSMAAAMVAYLDDSNATLLQIESAAEIGLEHSLGLTCDPILGYVQMPCIQRNAVGASRAITCAKIALASSEMEVVDFDTICKVMYETGKDMAEGYKETSISGLAKYFKTKN